MKPLLVLHWVCLAVVICQSYWHLKTALELELPDGSQFLPQKETLVQVVASGRPNTATRARDDALEKTKKRNQDEIPIVVISSLRPDYLQRVLEAIEPGHQSPETPSWIQTSKRYVFAHKNEHTDIDSRWPDTQEVAKHYSCELHVFEGLTTSLGSGRHSAHPIRAYYTKHAWYRMMRHLFYELQEKEVLILEDDAVLAPDGLLVAATLLEHKRNRSDGTIHGIALGGHAGENKVNADPFQFMAVRARFFQAMAYSMSKEVFDTLNANFQKAQSALETMTDEQLEEENTIELADWTMEITERQLLPDLTQLQPSVGRMHHIGVLQGMGSDGNGGKRRDEYPVPWALWNETVHATKARELYLFPLETTDTDGFVCDPPQWYCPDTPQPFKPTRFEPPIGYGRNRVPQRRTQKKEQEEYLRKADTPPKQAQSFQRRAAATKKNIPHKKKEDKKVKFWDLTKGGSGTVTVVGSKPKRTKGENVSD